MTRTFLLAATAVAALATSSLLVTDADAHGPGGFVGHGFVSRPAARPVSRPVVARPVPARLYSGTLRLGTMKYKPVPGIGSKLPAKATSPSAIKVTAVPGLKPINIGSKLTPIKMPVPGGLKVTPVPGLKPINIGSKLTPIKMPAPGGITVTPVPGLKPINIGSKLTPKTTLPTGTTAPSAPTTPAAPANPSTTKGPTNTGPYAVNVTFGRGSHWGSPTTTVAAATLPTEAASTATIDCRGRTEDGGYLTWQRAFDANGEPQLLCVRVFN
jgi:hypothetical protein